MANCLAHRTLSSQRDFLRSVRSLCIHIYRPQHDPQGNLRPHHQCLRHKQTKVLSSIIQPVVVSPVQSNKDDLNIGEELSGKLRKEKLVKILSEFHAKSEIRKLASENGLDQRLFFKAYISFRKYCLESAVLPTDLHVIFADIVAGSGNVDDLFIWFMQHSYEMFPHLECMEDLKKISDLTLPANWYPEARSIERKFIFHSGPTNSGKTYQAMESFMKAKSGVYCGPLKLLASEVFHKSNAGGTPCDLVTGEERRCANEDGETKANHVACTVEMANLSQEYEVAIIDEIQMLRDPQRGWAWTRAVLGIYAHEVHVCGEGAAVDLLKELALHCGEEVEVKRYERLTSLTYLDRAVEKFERIRPGDCIVCFNKNDIYHVAKQLEQQGKECAVIYGALPPSTKLAQAEKFNDPNNPCNYMVATDAIGMGLNLAIKRVVFYSLMKPLLNQKGELEMSLLSTSQALQIGGRAGRFNTQYENGEVTTFYSKDLEVLKKITKERIAAIEQSGLHPTADQIELFAYHLPNASLANLIDVFILSCELDHNLFFMCHLDDFKFLAEMIQHVPLSLRVRYVLCCSPISVKQPFACAMFVKIARRLSRSEPLTLTWLCRQLGWPLKPPNNLVELVHLESVFDVLDLYLWLSYRFPDMFPDCEHVREIQKELDLVIQDGVRDIVRLVKAQESMKNNGDHGSSVDNLSELAMMSGAFKPERETNNEDRLTMKTGSMRSRRAGEKDEGGFNIKNHQLSKDPSISEKLINESGININNYQLSKDRSISEKLIKDGLSPGIVQRLKKLLK